MMLFRPKGGEYCIAIEDSIGCHACTAQQILSFSVGEVELEICLQPFQVLKKGCREVKIVKAQRKVIDRNCQR